VQPYAVLKAYGASYMEFDLLVGSQNSDLLPIEVILEGVSCSVTRVTDRAQG
jgi:hypothetical protein